MRYLSIIIVGFLSLSFIKPPQGELNNAGVVGPKIFFEQEVYDFGKFKEGSIMLARFKFKNTGDAPLIIKKVEKPCSCTEPRWPKKPFQPGDTGSITLSYSSKERPGAFRKTLVVTTNMYTKKQPVLLIKGEAVHPKYLK